MKKNILKLLLLFIPFSLFTQELNVIPKVMKAEMMEGTFTINSNTQIILNQSNLDYLGDLMKDFLMENYQINLSKKVSNEVIDNSINFILENSSKKEAYSLLINDKSVVIKGDTAGLFNGLQTLLQLMPVLKSATVQLPKFQINDEPRFKHRGAMLDVGRYFFTVEEVKRFIDLMAYYKLNVLHWHLTEDAGWRIEIKKYPLLTKVGAWRRGTQIGHPHESFDKLPHGGFYSQDQVKDIVKYAHKRNITIIPEIDMPGHTLAALAAYPDLACTKGPFKVLENWGIQKDIMCAGNEHTYHFVEDILDEIMEMFPSEIIHIGGDEAPKERWKECRDCQEKIKKENLQNENELQSYFVNRIGTYLQSKGRKMLGWDEIMEGGLPQNAIVMSWRGEESGIKAAKMHHDVIMSPNNYMYLDYYQANQEAEPVNIHGYLPLELVYSYEPLSPRIPEENHKYIVGVQGNIWMEFIHSQAKLDYMAFPRLAAIAEIGWSTDVKKNFLDFQDRLSHNLNWLDIKNVNFRIPEPIGLKNIETIENELSVKLEPSIKGAEIYYTLNGDDPMENGILYISPIKIDLSNKNKVELNCIVRTMSGRVGGTKKAVYTKLKN